jgi:hypothetical protein
MHANQGSEPSFSVKTSSFFRIFGWGSFRIPQRRRSLVAFRRRLAQRRSDEEAMGQHMMRICSIAVRKLCKAFNKDIYICIKINQNQLIFHLNLCGEITCR